MSLGFLGNALNAVAGVLGIDDVAKSAIETVKALIVKDPKVRAAIDKQELAFKELSIKEGDNIRKMYGLEIQTEDPFVRRARPAMLWLVFGILTMNYGLIPLISVVTVAFGGTVIDLSYPEIPDSILALFATIFTVYAGSRSFDKRTKSKNGG